jgi:hypothetical protein
MFSKHVVLSLAVFLLAQPSLAEHANNLGNGAMGMNPMMNPMGNPMMFGGMGMMGMGMMGMGGMGMGMGGMGGGGGSTYNSKRESLSQSFEQPVKEAQKSIQEGTKQVVEQANSLSKQMSEMVASSAPKEEGLSEAVTGALSPKFDSHSEAISASVEAQIGAIQAGNQTTIDLLQRQAEVFVDRQPTSAGPTGASLGQRITGGTGSSSTAALSGAVAAEAPSVHDHAGNSGATSFQPGLLHNPPRGIQAQ